MSDDGTASENALAISASHSLVSFGTNPVFNRMAIGAISHAITLAEKDDIIAKPAFNLGQQCFEKGNFSEAVKHFSIAAELGHLTAQLRLGGIFHEGLGGLQDHELAFRWLSRAANQAEPRAQLKLGWIYEAGLGVPADNRRSVYWYRIAAEGGNPEAQFNIGVKYDNGEGVEQNPEEAVRWYLMAAEQGLPDAQYFLGQALEDGEGITQSQDEALDWYYLASETGHSSARRRFWSLCEAGAFKPETYEEAIFALNVGQHMGNTVPYFKEELRLISSSEETIYPEIIRSVNGTSERQFSLAIRYHNGNDVVQDYSAAIYWYKKASAWGHSGAFNNLGTIYNISETKAFDENKAAQCFKKAAELGCEVGMYNYANRLLSGRGIKKNVQLAVKLLKKSAHKEYVNSMIAIADLYYEGIDVESDYTVAHKWFKHAATRDSASGYFGLGLIYGQGFGVTKDLDQAKSYFVKAINIEPSLASRLAEFFEQGVIFSKDIKEAERWSSHFDTFSVDAPVQEKVILIENSSSNTARAQRLKTKRDKARPILGIFD